MKIIFFLLPIVGSFTKFRYYKILQFSYYLIKNYNNDKMKYLISFFSFQSSLQIFLRNDRLSRRCSNHERLFSGVGRKR